MKRLRNLFAYLGVAVLLAAGVARAETVLWSDNFDTNGASRWSVSATGVWKIVSPSAGPPVGSSGFRTHSGADCAFTGGYAYNKDARLVCHNYNGASSLAIPSADQYPRLRYWHWFNFANALGYVEISTNSGVNWTQLSPTYEDITGGGVWTRPSLDLSGYAGENVQIAFHFTSGGCCGNALGWFVDDVAVVTGTPTLNFPENFAAGLGDWSVDAGTWEVGKPTSGPGAALAPATNCAATVLAGGYANNVNSRLISPPFLVPAAGSPALSFWQWYNFNNALGFVELNNGSITVTTVTNTIITTNLASGLNTNIYQFFGSQDPNYAAPFYWNQTIGGWTNNLTNNVFKEIGNVLVLSGTINGYYFEAGDEPLTNDDGGIQVDYRADISPTPASNATNILALQGVTWTPVTESDFPVGYFATNSTTTTYTTNTTVSTGQSSWTQLSPTYKNSTSGGFWTHVSLDLSAYAGQTVFIAFHFTSGGIYTAPGWYVDDISLVALPQLVVPTNQTLYAGQELDVEVYATNGLPSDAQDTFRLVSPPANVFITNGEVTWQTASNQPPSTNTITVAVTDNNVPPLSATNSFVVSVVNPFVLTLPTTQTIYAGQTLVVTNYATNNLSDTDTFTFALLPTVITNLDTSDLSTDGVLTWPTMTTQKPGTYRIGIQAADDDVPYSATNSFLVVVAKPPPPVLRLPPTQTIYAGQTLVTNIYATNSAFPDSEFTYAVTKPPPGVSIVSTTGELRYTTIPTNKAQSVSISVVVTDTNTPPLSATGSFKVMISPTPGPKLTVPATQTNYAGMTLTVTNSATNAALSGATFTFRLPSVSANASLATNVCLTTNGVLTWTNTGVRNGSLFWTNTSISPGTKVITVAVDASPADYPKGSMPVSLSVTNHFDIVFLPPHPPSILGVTNQEIAVGQTPLPMAAVATNNYILLTNVTYTFTAPANVPANTNISVSTNGLITWRNVNPPPGTNRLSIVVRDNSHSPLMATNLFDLIILPPPVLRVPSTQTMHAGQTWMATISAANPFSRGSVFTFSLPSASTNYWIANTNGVGVLTWTNTFMTTNDVLNWTNSVSPGTNVIFVIATDNSLPGLSAPSNFDLIILPPLPPTLVVPAAQTVYAGQMLVVTNYATNGMLTNCVFTYATSGPGNMNATNGQLTWSTLGTQTSESYTNIITVMDNSAPPLSATKSLVIQVLTPPPPQLTVPPTQKIYAGQQLTVTNYASSVYGTNSSFTFQLFPASQTVMDRSDFTNNGVLGWNVPASQAAGNYTNVITVEDSVSQLSATNRFVIAVSNAPPPTLTVPPTQRVYAGQMLTVTNYASSVYGTNTSLTFQLLSTAQTGMNLSGLTTSGVLSWSVPTNQLAGSNTVAISVTDNLSQLSSTSNFLVVVSRSFPAPLLAVPPTQTIYAGQTLDVTNHAYYTNSVLPSSAFTYALLSTNLAGANLGTNSGVLIWATTIAQPAGTYTNIIMVVDSLTQLSASSNFLVQVLPPPLPTLIVPPTQSIYAGQLLVVTNYATNAAYPGSTFTFAAFGPTNLDVSNLSEGGVLKWTPTVAQAQSENTIYVMVTENNSLSTNGSFQVLVFPTPSPALRVSPLRPVFGANGFQFTVNTMAGTTWRIDASTNLLNWRPVATNLTGPSGALQFTDPVATNYLQRFYRAVLP